MSDLESQSQFLYEHRDGCHQIALLQIFVFLVSFVFTYSVWWSGLFGLLVATVGYFGTLTPVVQGKVSLIQFYYFGNCFILLLQLLSAAVLLVVVNEWTVMDGWAWAILIFGTLCFLSQIYLTWTAIQKSHSYRAELMRNPPPTELMIFTTSGGSAPYTPLQQKDVGTS